MPTLAWLAELFPRAFSSRVLNLMCSFLTPYQTKAGSTLLVDRGFTNKQMARETRRGHPFPASLLLILLRATPEENCSSIPMARLNSWARTRQAQRKEACCVYCSILHKKSIRCKVQVSAEVSVLMLRVNRESIRCPLHQ